MGAKRDTQFARFTPLTDTEPVRYVIVDLEATCWDYRAGVEQMEIIEIGAVLLPSASSPPQSEFSAFVQPIASRTLSDFCKTLTSIRQEDVDNAEQFWAVFPRFVEWCGREPFTLCSWGAYDLNQLRADCRRHKLPFPDSFEQHINLKQAFAKMHNIKPCGMPTALKLLNIPLEGTHHRGIDDARNIASTANCVLPQWEGQEKVESS